MSFNKSRKAIVVLLTSQFLVVGVIGLAAYRILDKKNQPAQATPANSAQALSHCVSAVEHGLEGDWGAASGEIEKASQLRTDDVELSGLLDRVQKVAKEHAVPPAKRTEVTTASAIPPTTL